MWYLIDDCTTSRAAIFEEALAENKTSATMKAFTEWAALTKQDRKDREAFYIKDEYGDSVDIMRGPYIYELRYWVSGQGYSHSETWDDLDYYLSARDFLDITFLDRDDAVGRQHDAVNVEVYLDGVLVDEFFYLKEV